MATFSQSVERWRSLVAKYFPPEAVDQALMIMELESGGQNIPSGFNAGGGEDSHGLFQINLDAHGSRISREQVYDPEANIRYAAQLYADQGWQPWSASRTPAFQQFKTGTGGGGSLTSTSAGPNVPMPNIEDFYYEDPITGKRLLDPAYYNALNQWKAFTSASAQDNSAYYDALIEEIGLEIETGHLKLAQAKGEFDRRFSALQEGNKMFAEMVGYAIPAGGPYPNSEFYAGMGLPATVPQTSSIDPFAMALDVVNQTPDLTQLGLPTIPDISGMVQSDLASQRAAMAASMATSGADPFNSALNNVGTIGNAMGIANQLQGIPWVERGAISESPLVQSQLNRSGGALASASRLGRLLGNQVADPVSSLGLYSQARRFLSGGLGKFLP